MINFIASNMNAKVGEKQALLEEPDIQKRSENLLSHITKEFQLLGVEK